MDEKQNAVKCLIDHLYEINYDCCFLVFLGVFAKFRRRGRPSFPYDINGIGKETGKSNYRHTAASSKQQVGLWDFNCLSNKIDVMFYKCGHIYCCENCAFKLNGTCPICRQKYDEIVKIYLR